MVISFISNLVQIIEEIRGQSVSIIFADDLSSLCDTPLQVQKKINALEVFCNTTGRVTLCVEMDVL